MALLQELPDRVAALEAQILQFRGEVKAEFAATRAELRQEMQELATTIKDELRGEIRTGDEDTRRYMRVLHEEVLSRIALLGERWTNGS